MERPVGGQVAGIACGLAAALIWGGFPVMTRLGVARSALDLYDITFLRYGVSGLLLLPVFLRWRLAGLGPWPVALLVAGIGAPYMLAVGFGLRLAPAGLFAVLTPGSMILFSALLAALWLRRPMPLRERGAIGLILVGLAVAGSAAAAGLGVAAVGFLLLAGFLWAVYTVATRVHPVSALPATAIVSVISALIYAPFYFALKGLALFSAPIDQLLLHGVYQGVLVSVVALYFYSRSVALLGPTVGASFAALVPVIAVIEAIFILDETPSVTTLAGLAIVTAGMGAVLWVSRPSARRMVGRA